MPAEDLQTKFSTLLKAVRAAAIRNGVISTAILPLVFVFDTLTFIRKCPVCPFLVLWILS